MKYTQNYNLRKPEDTDPADIQDLNYNADAIDGKLKEIEDWEAAHLQASNPHGITPALIGAETPTGAQTKVNAHEQKAAPHSGHETPSGAQAKANAALAEAKLYAENVAINSANNALNSAKDYADEKANQAETNAKSYADTVANSALNSAKDYADGVLESANSRTDQVASDLSHKLNETRIKVLDVERDVSNISKVLTSLNPNQEAKQSVSGYGILSLPKNAANGQVSDVVVKGLTVTNLLGYGEVLRVLPPRPGAGSSPKIFDNLSLPQDKYLIFYELVQTVETFNVNSPFYNSTTLDNIDPDQKTKNNTVGRKVWKLDAPKTITKIGWWVYDTESEVHVKNFMVVKATEEDWLLSEEKLVQKYNWHNDTKSTVSAMRIRIVSEDEAEGSTAYVLAKDEDGNIEELRSLPNGTKDEIDVVSRRLIKRIGEKINVSNGTVINYTDMADNGTYYAWNENGETETGTKGDTLGIDATTLTYQLAEPIEIPIQTSGSLVSYPSGTVYIEPFVADAGIYADKMEVLYSDLPIKALEKISKVDFNTGLETELDITAAVIAEDKLSFTHPDLTSGDIVFFVYEHGAEGTIPETEISYYDSRYVIKDSVTEKFYKWHIAVADGVPSIELTEV